MTAIDGSIFLKTCKTITWVKNIIRSYYLYSGYIGKR